MVDRGYDSSRVVEATVAMKVDATPEMFRQATEAWARDSGWVRADDTGHALVFDADASGVWGKHGSSVFLALEMACSTSRRDNETWGEFSASVATRLSALYAADLEPVAQTFAQGVSRYLEGLTTGTRPLSPGSRLPESTRRGTAVKWLKLVQQACVVSFVPALIVGSVLDGSGSLILSIALWVGTLMLTLILVRYRIFGMRARYLTFLTYMMWAFTLVLTAVEVFL